MRPSPPKFRGGRGVDIAAASANVPSDNEMRVNGRLKGNRRHTCPVVPPGSSVCGEWAVQGERKQSRSPAVPPALQRLVKRQILPHCAAEYYAQTPAEVARHELSENA
jgi:hypothetical protein